MAEADGLEEALESIGAKYPALRGLMLREHQKTIIQHVLNHKHCFVSLPTGYGKSLTYVIPILILDEKKNRKCHTSLVITPLLNLMKEQATRLQASGIAAVCVSADISETDEKVLMSGNAQVIFATPEAAILKVFKMKLRKHYQDRLAVISCDESHCITDWGETFRQSYRQLPQLSTLFSVPFLFVTATATQKIQDDVLDLFHMKDAEKVIVLPDRPDIRLDVHKTPHSFRVLTWVLARLRVHGVSAPKTVVFTNSIDETGKLYEFVMEELDDMAFEGGVRQANKRFVEMYHSAVSEERESYVMGNFPRPDTKIRLLLSTIRLGMGVDIPDIETVVVFGAPQNVVALWQEIGRAARARNVSGLGVVYLTKRTMRKEAKRDEWIHGLDNPEGCHRVHILQAFTTKSIEKKDTFSPPTEVCDGECVGKCGCSKCRCCDRCAETCHCPMKAIAECCSPPDVPSDPEEEYCHEEADVESD